MDESDENFKPYPAKYVVGFRGATFLLDAENFVYRFHKQLKSSATNRYRCRITSEATKAFCPGAAFVHGSEIVGYHPHNHAPSATEVAVMLKKQAVLELVSATP